ncbi:DUF1444 family protein [Verrucomicrobiaceae bacterium 227]
MVESFVADLCVTFAFENGEVFQSLNSRGLDQVGVEASELRELAKKNLRTRTGKIGIEEHEKITRLIIGEDMEACLLLYGELWHDFEKKFGGELVVAVPTRSELAFVVLRGDGGLEALRDYVQKCFAHEPTHRLTEHLLIWRGGSWKVFE